MQLVSGWHLQFRWGWQQRCLVEDYLSPRAEEIRNRWKPVWLIPDTMVWFRFAFSFVSNVQYRATDICTESKYYRLWRWFLTATRATHLASGNQSHQVMCGTLSWSFKHWLVCTSCTPRSPCVLLVGWVHGAKKVRKYMKFSMSFFWKAFDVAAGLSIGARCWCLQPL